MSDLVIRIKDLTVAFGAKKALDNVSVTFEPGKIYCILGPNGCGKSTLVKNIIHQYSQGGEIAYVAQETYGSIALPLLDYVSLGRYDRSKFFSGISATDRELVGDAIRTMDLTGMESQIFDTLSGGEKQRAMVARALAQDTGWFILDEPTSSLDVKHVRMITDMIRDLASRGRSVIIVLHDLNAASGVADRFIMMKSGRIVANVDTLDRDLLTDVYDTPFVTAVTEDGRMVWMPE